jgi:hypothetical protein
MLRRSALTLTLLAGLALPVSAQDSRDFAEGMDLLSEGARRLMEHVVGELGPLLLQLESLMDEITAYQAPEMLPNGDIIIRRRPDAPQDDFAGPEAEDSIEL